MRIYVASKFENTRAVRDVYEVLKEDGHVITHDWTGENADGLTGDAKEAYLQGCADKDVEGVLSADAFVLLNHVNMAGGFTELGMALAAGKFIVVLDGRHPQKPMNIFYHLPHVHHAKSVYDARQMLKAHALFMKQEAEVE